MSEAINSKTATSNAIECILSATDSYIENLSMQGTGLQPVPLELVVRIQLLSAKSPAETRVKSRKRIGWSRLIALQQGIGQLLEETESSSPDPDLS